MLPIELSLQALGLKATLRALLDSGCTSCLVNPPLVEKLGFHLKLLKVPITFFQLDEGIPATFVIEAIKM